MSFCFDRTARYVKQANGFALLLLLITATPLLAQSTLTVRPGGTLTVSRGTLRLSGNLATGGTFDATSGRIHLVGTGTQTFAPGAGNTLQALVIDKPSTSAAQLADTIAVTDSVRVLGGNLNLNGKQIDLGQSGGLRETAGNTLTGTSGTITATRFLNAPDAVNVGGLGARLTSEANMSATVVTRGHAPQTGTSANEGIARYYDIEPGVNNNLDATLEFFYDESELSGRDETTLALWRSTNDGATYTEVGGTVIPSANVIALSGINTFSLWTATGDGTPLPVELASFQATMDQDEVVLTWRTLSERESAHFVVERRTPEAQAWTPRRQVAGAGTTEESQNYRVLDTNLPFAATDLQYRLRQVDLDGTTTYSDAITVTRATPLAVELHGNFPNPVRTQTTIRYTLPAAMDVHLAVYDVLGREVRTLVNGRQAAGRKEIAFDATTVPSGLYLYRLRTNGETQTARFSVVR